MNTEPKKIIQAMEIGVPIDLPAIIVLYAAGIPQQQNKIPPIIPNSLMNIKVDTFHVHLSKDDS